MAKINAITGLKRKLPRYETRRKKRETACLCSTVASRMYEQQAMEAFVAYLNGCYKAVILMVISFHRNDDDLVRLLAVFGLIFLYFGNTNGLIRIRAIGFPKWRWWSWILKAIIWHNVGFFRQCQWAWIKDQLLAAIAEQLHRTCSQAYWGYPLPLNWLECCWHWQRHWPVLMLNLMKKPV